jgi:uncharacterized membrane protein
MAGNIIVLGFEGKTTADDMLTLFQDWQEEGLVTIEDAVVAVRGESSQVEIKQTRSVKGKYAVRGGGIGLLAGVLLGGPIGGLVAGTAIGAIGGAMKDLGIDDKFIQDATKALPPNSSALFLMGRAEDPERFYEALGPYKATVATTTLSPEQEQRLKRVLAEEK